MVDPVHEESEDKEQDEDQPRMPFQEFMARQLTDVTANCMKK